MEGPSIVILAEEAKKFVGHKVLASSGSSKTINLRALKGQKLVRITSWGKHFLLCFSNTVVRVHFMLFGSYRIDETRPGMKPRVALRFSTGEFRAYACSLRQLDASALSAYDSRVDIMSPLWDEELVLTKLAQLKPIAICDALLLQDLFAGVGNIIKNEVLFRVRLHPETPLATLSRSQLRLLVRETRLYSFQFFLWKKQFVLRKNWQIYRKSICPRCERKVTLKQTGTMGRRSFFCENCQKQSPKRAGKKVRQRIAAEALLRVQREIKSLEQQVISGTAQTSSEREH